jgi:hypothetical protein
MDLLSAIDHTKYIGPNAIANRLMHCSHTANIIFLKLPKVKIV